MHRLDYSLDLFKEFLDSSPTSWHAVESIVALLKKYQFKELSSKERWSIEPGKGYFVVHHDSSIAIFITPTCAMKRVRLFASHTDSPALKLKPSPEIYNDPMISMGVETYGSPLLSSWLNRDLKLAGKVIYKNFDHKICQQLLQLDNHPMIIPQLAIHLDREINEKGLQLNKQNHLNSLASLQKVFSSHATYLKTLIKEKVTDFSQLIDFELFLVPMEKASFIGYKKELLASYRIDSLASVHDILCALLKQKDPLQNDLKMALFWDHEEIGSNTPQGAASPFFEETFKRIANGLKMEEEERSCVFPRSTCISVDLAHALHPNYLEKHDLQHRPLLGEGVVIKYSASQRYATNLCSALPIYEAAQKAQVPIQKFVSRNDIPSGSTIGPIHASATGMQTVDIGCAQLSMHSCREILAWQDQQWLFALLCQLMKIEPWPEISP